MTFPTPPHEFSVSSHETRGLRVGDEVTIHYTTTTLEGGVLETSHDREPLTFRLGDPAFVSGLADALIGQHAGDHLSVRLAPAASFGHRRDEWQTSVPKSELPDGVGVGSQLTVHSGEGAFPVWVQKIAERDAVLDANHPLADETTLVEVDIIAVQPF